MRLALILLLAWPGQVAAQDRELVELATRTLSSLQDISFRKRREYCGFFGYRADGTLVATPAVQGELASCGASLPDDVAVIASYHTHGAFDQGYINEIPSTTDVAGDAELYIDGFVSTPGGRLWFVDGRTRETFQICGPGCLPVSPQFRKGVSGPIAQHYTYDELVEAFRD